MLENINVIHGPFHECTNDEFNKKTCTENYKQFSCYTNTSTNISLSNKLPLYNCSDYEIILEFMTAKDGILETFEKKNYQIL